MRRRRMASAPKITGCARSSSQASIHSSFSRYSPRPPTRAARRRPALISRARNRGPRWTRAAACSMVFQGEVGSDAIRRCGFYRGVSGVPMVRPPRPRGRAARESVRAAGGSAAARPLTDVRRQLAPAIALGPLLRREPDRDRIDRFGRGGHPRFAPGRHQKNKRRNLNEPPRIIQEAPR